MAYLSAPGVVDSSVDGSGSERRLTVSHGRADCGRRHRVHSGEAENGYWHYSIKVTIRRFRVLIPIVRGASSPIPIFRGSTPRVLRW